MNIDIINSLSTFLDKEEKDIEELVVTMDFKDLAKISSALRNNDEKEVLRIMHGYGL